MEPKFSDLLGETPLVAQSPGIEPMAVKSVVLFAENWHPVKPLWRENEHPPGSSALLAPPCDEVCDATLVPMPRVPHWSNEVGAGACVLDNDSHQFGFLNGRRGARLTLLDPPATSAERFLEFEHAATNGKLPPWDAATRSGNSDIPLQSQVTAAPLLTYSVRLRPVTPSGTMYLWSTTSEARAAERHLAAGTSAGVVLTRPPGDYSIDWVGIAVTAPIQWR